jgi:hypothetical protein
MSTESESMPEVASDCRRNSDVGHTRREKSKRRAS